MLTTPRWCGSLYGMTVYQTLEDAVDGDEVLFLDPDDGTHIIAYCLVDADGFAEWAFDGWTVGLTSSVVSSRFELIKLLSTTASRRERCGESL